MRARLARTRQPFEATVFSYSSFRAAQAKSFVRGAFAVVAASLAIACSDAAAPRPVGPVVKQVVINPSTLDLGRGDRIQVTARVLDQDGNEMTGRTITYSSDNPAVALIGSPDNVVGAPGFLIAAGAGATKIRATVDGVTGTANVSVVVADTTFALNEFNGSPLPFLIAADSVMNLGVKEFHEVYVDQGKFVLSGLAQLRYNVEVGFTEYAVFNENGVVRREFRRSGKETDHGIVESATGGHLSMLSEFIGPHLEHSADLLTSGYLVHFSVPGDDITWDLRYSR
jgi:hypothetical protein